MSALTERMGGLDAPKAAGIITIGAVLVLALLRKGFHGVSVGIGD